MQRPSSCTSGMHEPDRKARPSPNMVGLFLFRAGTKHPMICSSTDRYRGLPVQGRGGACLGFLLIRPAIPYGRPAPPRLRAHSFATGWQLDETDAVWAADRNVQTSHPLLCNRLLDWLMRGSSGGLFPSFFSFIAKGEIKSANVGAFVKEGGSTGRGAAGSLPSSSRGLEPRVFGHGRIATATS